jgi:hydroxysqualene synthase
MAIYHFARTADDLADEGDASTSQRLADLTAFRLDLASVAAGNKPDPRWSAIFVPLAAAIAEFSLPVSLLDDLLDAFIQDTGNPPYLDRDALLDYCRRSANPIGRLLLHLYGVNDALALAQSDAVCSALQLINFWQDFSVDHPRGRCYLPLADAEAHGVNADALMRGRLAGPPEAALLADLLDWTQTLMRRGAPLARRVPGRAGWELRLVVQGGLRVLEKIRQMNPASFDQRPRLGAADLPVLLWRAALASPG